MNRDDNKQSLEESLRRLAQAVDSLLVNGSTIACMTHWQTSPGFLDKLVRTARDELERLRLELATVGKVASLGDLLRDVDAGIEGMDRALRELLGFKTMTPERISEACARVTRHYRATELAVRQIEDGCSLELHYGGRPPDAECTVESLLPNFADYFLVAAAEANPADAPR